MANRRLPEAGVKEVTQHGDEAGYVTSECGDACKWRASGAQISKTAKSRLLRDTDISPNWRYLREYRRRPYLPEYRSMSPFSHFIDGLFGLTAASSFAGFVFHLLRGNPDLALMCFVGIGGSAAMVWMLTAWRRA